ncbi:MAG: hypothetical protein U0871_23305 [Gemmataceae bacterium]
MATLTFAQVRSLLTPPAGPCVSLYLSAQQSHPDTQQNDTLLRELADQADRSLRSAGQEQVGRPLLDRIHGLVGNTGFWADATPGWPCSPPRCSSRRSGCPGRWTPWPWWRTAST